MLANRLRTLATAGAFTAALTGIGVLTAAPASAAASIQIHTVTAGDRPYANPVDVDLTYTCDADSPAANLVLTASADLTAGVGREAARCNGSPQRTTVEVTPVLGSDGILGSFSRGDTVAVEAALVAPDANGGVGEQLAVTSGSFTAQ